jgi:hypothetical protein
MDQSMPNTPLDHNSPSSSSLIRVHAGLFVLVCLIFGRALWHPFSEWDDVSFILRNPLITAPGKMSLSMMLLTPQMGYIVPVSVGVKASLFGLGGGAAWPFAAMGVLLHASLASLLFNLGRQLKLRFGLCLAVACCFAVHPLVTEPVVWATGLKEQLMAWFAVAGTLSFVRGTRNIQSGGAPGVWLSLAVVLGVCAFLSKPSAVLLGGVWLAWLGASTRSSRASDTTTHIASAWKAAGLLALIGAGLAVFNALMRTVQMQSQANSRAFSPTEPLLALGHHIYQLLFPFSLHPAYPLDRAAGWSHPFTYLGGLVILMGVLALWSARRSPTCLLGLALAVLAYAPTSQVIPFPRFVSDSYMYLPLVGLLLALAGACEHWWQRHPPSPARLRWMALLGLLLALGYSGKSASQVGRWANPQTLWGPLTQAHPRWYYPWIHIAQGYQGTGQHKPALRAYLYAFRLDMPTQFLGALGKSLLINRRLQDAECVILTDVLAGPRPVRAARNYWMFLVMTPTYQVRYPVQAMMTYQRLRRARVSLPAGLLGRFRQRYQQVHKQARQTQQKPVQWGPRHCRVLSTPARKPALPK